MVWCPLLMMCISIHSFHISWIKIKIPSLNQISSDGGKIVNKLQVPQCSFLNVFKIVICWTGSLLHSVCFASTFMLCHFLALKSVSYQSFLHLDLVWYVHAKIWLCFNFLGCTLIYYCNYWTVICCGNNKLWLQYIFLNCFSGRAE